MNKMPESVIFNKIILPKIDPDLKAINDFYYYDPKKTGIAPDVIGVLYHGKTVPFAVFDNK